MDCNFKDSRDKCTIGCKSINIGKLDPCPFAFTSDSFKICPCHPDGLTFFLTNRIEQMVQTEDTIWDKEEIKRLVVEGHTYHCACRIVWGDGQCECKMEDPIETKDNKI